MALLIASACSQGDDPGQQRVTATGVIETLPAGPQPTPLPTTVRGTASLPPTLSPSPVPTVTPVVKTQTPTRPTRSPELVIVLPELAPDRVEISQCRISGDLAKSGVSRQGTAPAPTVTPVPTDRSRPRELVEKELAEFRVEAVPAVVALSKFNSAFQNVWPHADTAEKQAAQLHIFGNRLAQLCSATSQLEIPPEVFSEAVGLGDSIRARHAWTGAAFDELFCCGDAHTDFLDVGLALTNAAIIVSTSNLTKLLDDLSINGQVDSERSISSERFGLTMVIGNDAVVVRNTVDMLVMFTEEPEIPDSGSLGPGTWYDGTAIRIRRLRNGFELSASLAITEYESLIARIGELNRDRDLDVAELNGIRLSYVSLADSWNGSVTVFVKDGFTYFVESLCRQSEPDVCESVRVSVESIRLQK